MIIFFPTNFLHLHLSTHTSTLAESKAITLPYPQTAPHLHFGRTHHESSRLRQPLATILGNEQNACHFSSDTVTLASRGTAMHLRSPASHGIPEKLIHLLETSTRPDPLLRRLLKATLTPSEAGAGAGTGPL
ncbi:hypothetical protein E2C01_097509 [Portunus trituberculatus]|uniref:Uncharacterized protein n=1 Tax=Portunus trituberculatus TaxID=210409 RepID=A0A5B7K5V1_PORTR|nr:hypothetical protein [Portunus trituberculatus]